MDNLVFASLIAGLADADEILEKKSAPVIRYSISEVNMRKARELLRMSQSEFAEMLGLRTKTLQLLEKGRRRPSAAVVALCRLIVANPIFVHDTLVKPTIAEVDGSLVEQTFTVTLQQVEE